MLGVVTTCGAILISYLGLGAGSQEEETGAAEEIEVVRFISTSLVQVTRSGSTKDLGLDSALGPGNR